MIHAELLEVTLYLNLAHPASWKTISEKNISVYIFLDALRAIINALHSFLYFSYYLILLLSCICE